MLGVRGYLALTVFGYSAWFGSAAAPLGGAVPARVLVEACGAESRGLSRAPSYEALREGAWGVRLLPGQSEFVFTMYTCPDDVETLRALIAFMKERGLGNGFDPGPPAHATSKALFEVIAGEGWPVIAYPAQGDMQVKEGRTRLDDADEAALQVLDAAGVFAGVHLGEWGYYFHRLSMDAGYWKGLYGEDFDAYQHLMKPAEFRGYDSLPETRAQCYAILRDYFTARHRAMRGRNVSVTGHSHYETYAAEWGALLVGLELGENIGYAQSKIAFARGAARTYAVPWSAQISPWFKNSFTTRGPLRMEGGTLRGLDAGHSLSLYDRMELHAWFSGAAMVTPENSGNYFFEAEGPPYVLTPYGARAAELFAFMRGHERGIPYTPLGIVLDRLNGYNGYEGKPWGILENTPADLEVRDLFEQQLWPGSARLPEDAPNPEANYLVQTPYGEIADVLRSNAPAPILGAYPVILLAGDISFDAEFIARLHQVARGGTRILLHPRHAEALGEETQRLMGTGPVEVLEAWTNPVTKRPAAIADARLEAIARQYLPVRVTGDPVQFAVNRTPRGWVVELVNNGGVTKTPGEPAVIDPHVITRVRLSWGFDARAVRIWGAGPAPAKDRELEVSIAPGSVVYVEFETDASR